MNNQDFGFVADALLALCERDNEKPFYSDEEFRHKLIKASRKEPFASQLPLAEGHQVLLHDECCAVFEKARLTKRQADVLTRRLEGFTFEEIGDTAGHSKQGAQSIFVQALKKLSRSFHVYRYTGLSDVYRKETRRGVRRNGFGRMFPKP